MVKKNSQFQTIRTEGALLPPDILRLVSALKVNGASAEDYHLAPGSKINEAISQSWTGLLSHWQAFQEARTELPSSDETATKLTNDRWLLPLFKELDYGRLTTEKSPIIDDRTYPIERFYQHTPIHLIGCRLPLDRRTKGARGAATASPYSMVQEYLNRSDDHLWAFLSNGLQLRILRDNISLSRQAFIEFDLEAMFDGEIYSDFALLWLICHQSRVEGDKPSDCWLEKWSKLAKDQGTRVLKQLRDGVANAISALGQGFIGHPKNDVLRDRLQSGALSKEDFYRQILRVVYRLLFLFVAEDRELLHPLEGREEAKQLYDKYYSTRRLRELSRKMRGSRHGDLWHTLSLVFSALSKNEGCPELALTGLGSFLWRTESTADLLGPYQVVEGKSQSTSLINNDDLLLAIRSLAYTEQDKVLRSVDYRNLGSEEFGSVYESLLELHPILHVEAKSFLLDTAAGNERKTTGSYYSPDPLVQELLDSALEPVIEQRLREAKELANKAGNLLKGVLPRWFVDVQATLQLPASYSQLAELALLSLKICDPACGSGHFLIGAAHRLARHLASIRTGESEPGPDDYQHALRDVIGRCIYGVDLNPMAVELCKVSLWMEAIEPGKPLSFLDHHIQCGNSLLGSTPALLKQGISSEAFKPIEGDDKVIVSKLKKQNQRELTDRKSGQRSFFENLSKLDNFPNSIANIDLASDDSVDAIIAKQAMYDRLIRDENYLNARLLADMWCVAFVWKKTNDELGLLCPSEELFRRVESNPQACSIQVRDEVQNIAHRYQFFHWHLAFPDVFRVPTASQQCENPHSGWNGGFDVVLGNPPWERVKLQEKEWFAERSPAIANAPNAAARKRMIVELQTSDPILYQQFLDDSRKAEGESHLIRSSERYPLCGRGDINVYTIFAEGMRTVLNPEGRAGCILPSGIATDDTTKFFFQEVIESQSLVSLFDFENKGIFPGVHSSYKFCLFTTGSGIKPLAPEAEFVFFAHSVDELRDPNRRFTLSAADITLLNPNTRTCPIFRSRADAELTKGIYRRVPVLIREAEGEKPEENSWGIKFNRMFDMSNDSQLFRTREQLEQDGFGLDGNVFLCGQETWLPLYEAKMFHQFTHRWASAEAQDDIAQLDLKNPDTQVFPRYWILQSEVEKAVESRRPTFMLAYRWIARTTDERTCIATVVPFAGFGNSSPVIRTQQKPAMEAILTSALSSFACDFTTRQKLGGANLTYGTMNQLAVPSPRIVADQFNFILQRVLELVYTAWDLQMFARDCGYIGPPFCWDEERRFLLRCELDAAFFHLYLRATTNGEWLSATRQDCCSFVETIEELDELKKHFPFPRDAVAYILETFPIVKRKDFARSEVSDKHGNITEGTFKTKETILSVYDAMSSAKLRGEEYKTRLAPPPGPPADALGNFIAVSQWDPKNWPSHIHKQTGLANE